MASLVKRTKRSFKRVTLGWREGLTARSPAWARRCSNGSRLALTRNATHAPSLLNLAALHATAGELDRARPLWERALRTGLTPFERRKVEALLTVK